MQAPELILTVLIGILVGAFGLLTSGYSKGGWVLYLMIGIIGAFVGAWAETQVNVPELYVITIGESIRFQPLWPLLGSVLAVAVVGFFIRPGR